MVTTHLCQDIRLHVVANTAMHIPSGTLVFDEKDPLFNTADPSDNYHITLYSAGGSRINGMGRKSTQAFSVEVRGKRTETSKHIIEKIAEYMQASYTGLCILPVVPEVSDRKYINCQITEVGNITNLGEDSESKTLFRIDAQITYKKEN